MNAQGTVDRIYFSVQKAHGEGAFVGIEYMKVVVAQQELGQQEGS